MPEIGMAHLHKDKVYFMKLTKCEKDAFAYNTARQEGFSMTFLIANLLTLILIMDFYPK
jgi:hypothetical protein